MPTWDAFTRNLCRGGDRGAARAADRDLRGLAERDQRARAISTILPFIRSREGMPFGTTTLPSGDIATARVPFRIARGLSSWCVGATGAGKTTAITSLTASDLVAPNVVVLCIAFAGDYATNVTNALLPSIAMGLSPERGAELLAGLRVIAPWEGGSLPSLHVTAAGGDIPRRAQALVDLFNATVGGTELGVRQQTVFTHAVKLLMRNAVPFPLLADVLTNERFRQALLTAADDAELSQYFRTRFDADSREGLIGGILARADRFAADESTRHALYGPDAFTASVFLESGTLVANLAGGTGSHVKFWAGFTLHEIVTAVLARRPRRTSPQVVVRIDEVQLGVPTPDAAYLLETALSTMRSKKASVHIAHQHVAQLAHFPSLVSSLRTNTAIQCVFRQPAEAVGAISLALPEGLPYGVEGAGLSEAQVRDLWERVLVSLPDRNYFLRVPTLSPSSIPVRAFDLDLDGLRRSVPEEIRSLAENGQGGFGRDVLRTREEVWHRAVQDLSDAADPNTDALRDLAGLDRPGHHRASEDA